MKSLIKRTPLYHPIRNWRLSAQHEAEIERWERAGRPLPPPHPVKQETLRAYARQYGLRILVETGTFRGDMIEALRRDFDRIYSIELSDEFHAAAVRRFRSARHIELIHGDSAAELRKLLPRIDQPALFWLDGHYSGAETARGAVDTPVCAELRDILSAPDRGHVMIVDDARCFGTEPGYPSIADLQAIVMNAGRPLELALENDSLRITPAPEGRSRS